MSQFLDFLALAFVVFPSSIPQVTIRQKTNKKKNDKKTIGNHENLINLVGKLKEPTDGHGHIRLATKNIQTFCSLKNF